MSKPYWKKKKFIKKIKKEIRNSGRENLPRCSCGGKLDVVCELWGGIFFAIECENGCHENERRLHYGRRCRTAKAMVDYEIFRHNRFVEMEAQNEE